MSLPRIRGLVSLVRDAVDGGSRAVQKVQLGIAKRTFDILEAVPGVREPTKVVHLVYDLSVNSTHGIIRLVNGAVGGVAEVALDRFDRRSNIEQKSPCALGEERAKAPVDIAISHGDLAQEESARNNTDHEPPAGSSSE
jgi:hypothetical protein